MHAAHEAGLREVRLIHGTRQGHPARHRPAGARAPPTGRGILGRRRLAPGRHRRTTSSEFDALIRSNAGKFRTPPDTTRELRPCRAGNVACSVPGGDHNEARGSSAPGTWSASAGSDGASTGTCPTATPASSTSTGCGVANRGEAAQFLLPFEPVDRLPTVPDAPPGSRARWRHVVRHALANATPSWASLQTAASARPDPHAVSARARAGARPRRRLPVSDRRCRRPRQDRAGGPDARRNAAAPAGCPGHGHLSGGTSGSVAGRAATTVLSRRRSDGCRGRRPAGGECSRAP